MATLLVLNAIPISLALLAEPLAVLSQKLLLVVVHNSAWHFIVLLSAALVSSAPTPEWNAKLDAVPNLSFVEYKKEFAKFSFKWG